MLIKKATLFVKKNNRYLTKEKIFTQKNCLKSPILLLFRTLHSGLAQR